jgi:hypothetical protein
MAIQLSEFFMHKLREAPEMDAQMQEPLDPTAGAFTKQDPGAMGQAQAFTPPAEQRQILPANKLNYFQNQMGAIVGNLGDLGNNPAVASGVKAMLTGMDQAAYEIYIRPDTDVKFTQDWSSAAGAVQGAFSTVNKSFKKLAPEGPVAPTQG